MALENVFDYSFDIKTRRRVVKNYLAVLEVQSSKVIAWIVVELLPSLYLLFK
jgi:hypothetical protein